MTCCIDNCNNEAKHEAYYGPICDYHLRQDQRRSYEAYQQRQWAERDPETPMPDHAKSHGLQEMEQDARIEAAKRQRQVEEGIEE